MWLPSASHLFTGNIMAKRKKSNQKWVRDVKTVSTFPKEGLFKQDAETIAKAMASKKVSPKGIGSGIRMVQYFINRAGKDLPAARKRELEKAKHILQEKAKDKESQATHRKAKMS
jgi:tRNA(adenine34) deaminase